MTETTHNTTTTRRPPIVVVMGHIDHGKTTMLDWYRKTKVVDSESGGITQHIGAYEVEHGGRRITFIDTPGHEAFSKMRSRGAKVADIGILVVAAEEGIKPQTKEALAILQENNVPFVIAFNKIDKPESNPERIKQQFAEAGVLVESYGGKIPSAEVSAKTGKGMEELLEVVQILSELEDLTADEDRPAEGIVIEAHLDAKRGMTATLLVQNGTLKKGLYLTVGKTAESVKILENFLGKSIESAGPSSPVRVVGLSRAPVVGDVFGQFDSKKDAESHIADLPPERKEKPKQIAADRPIFNLIIKSDVVGSKEVLEESLKKLESEVITVNILRNEIGDIGEGDVKLALATKTVTIIGFKVKVDAATKELAQHSNIRIIQGDIIYELLDQAKKRMEELIPPTITRIDLGKLKILKVFKKEGQKQIIGGRVEDGVAKNGTKFEVRRLKEVIGPGTILSLQRNKSATDTVEKGNECGLMVESKTAIQEDDLLQIYQEEITKSTL